MQIADLEKIKKVAVIMAGEAGDSLWPCSVKELPKEYNHFFGFGTMIQNTIRRLFPIFSYDEIYIVTDSKYKGLILDQVPEIKPGNIIEEPFGKNTATCLGLFATVKSDILSDDTIMVAFPSDHVIYNIEEFHNSLITGIKFAYSSNSIVTLGIYPTKPETSFGYVQIRDTKDNLEEFYDLGVRYTSAFAEKPDTATAIRFLESGDFLWNSGIFIWRVDTFWDSYKVYLPEHYKEFQYLKDLIKTEYILGMVEETYRKLNSVSVDYAILEKAENVYVVKSTFAWSDLNNWDEVYEIKTKDARGNFFEGLIIPINVKNSYVKAKHKLIGLVDIEDLIVIEDDNAILICKRGSSDKVREIVKYLKRKHIMKFQ